MVISSYNSQKIKVLNFIAILFVLLIHSNFSESVDFPKAMCVQLFLGTSGMSLAAVPLFYFISGLLFFKGIVQTRDLFPKIIIRTKTLLIPYVIWNLFFVGWYVVMAYMPGVSLFVNSNMMDNLQWQHPIDTLSFLFINPAGFHLWFLRDLTIYVFASPLLYWSIKRTRWITYVVLLVVFGQYLRCGITYFALGGIISQKYSLEQLQSWISKPVILCCACLYLMGCFIAANILPFPVSSMNPYYQQVMSLLGIIAIWGGYELVLSVDYKFPSWFTTATSYTFFVYLFHEPAFNIIKKLSLRVIGCSDMSLIILYLFNPIFMIVIAILIGMTFKKILPKTYSVCVGGR